MRGPTGRTLKQFELSINLENDAFKRGDGPAEIARLLRELSEDIEEEFELEEIRGGGTRADFNGNAAMKFSFR